jgi:hypothetical protein
MSNFHINDNDLQNTYKLYVDSFRGWENLPKRKDPTEYDWPDKNGVEPFLEASEIVFEARDITITGTIQATDILDAQTQLMSLQSILYPSVPLLVRNDILGRVFYCYVKDQPMGTILAGSSSSTPYEIRLSLKLKEIDPTNKLIFKTYTNFEGDTYTNFTGSEYYGIFNA